MLYQNDGEIQYDLDFISFTVNYDKEIVKSVINDFGLFSILDKDRLMNARVFEAIKEITEKSNKARANANKRHYGN